MSPTVPYARGLPARGPSDGLWTMPTGPRRPHRCFPEGRLRRGFSVAVGEPAGSVQRPRTSCRMGMLEMALATT